MATCDVSGTIRDISAGAIEGAVVKARIVTPTFVGTVQYVPTEVDTTTNASGVWQLTLERTLKCIITI